MEGRPPGPGIDARKPGPKAGSWAIMGDFNRSESESMIIHSGEVDHIAVPGAGAMRIHLFRPAVPGRFPALLFYSEIYQVTGPVRRLAATMAGHGFLVGVPEVYHDHEAPGTILAYDEEGTRRGNELKTLKPLAAFDADAHAAVGYLRDHEVSTGYVATMGMCLGGHLALRAAFNPAISAAIWLYATDVHSGTLGAGRNDDTLARLAELRGEALFIWGRQDPHIPFEGRERIRTRLEEARVRYEWSEVNAAHAFMRDEGPRFDPALHRMILGNALSVLWRTNALACTRI